MPPTDRSEWPEHLIALARTARTADDSGRARASRELWALVRIVLLRRAFAVARRAGGLPAADLEDAVSDKLLELVARIDSRRWEPANSHPGEVVNFLATVARNAVVDLLRQRGRRTEVDEGQLEFEAPNREHAMPSGADAPGSGIDRERFVRSLLDCAGRLTGRDFEIWRLRVLLELPTREIAEHPAVRLRPAHVDVILQRCRQRVKACMRSAGFELEPLPAGTFATLWEATRRAWAEGGS